MDNRNMLQLCRLCLVKDDVNIPIFEEHGDIRQIFLKITSCLPVKVSRDDKLPKKICDGCSYKLETLYEFWNTSVNAEKQLLAWLGEAGMNSEMADGTITAVAQQIKPTDTFVKQETVDPPDVHSEDHDQKDYVFQQKFESASAGPSATVTSNEEEEPPPKRARRTAAVKAAIAMDRDSDDDDDSGEPITKVEDESEESDGEDHTFADAPSTSADDQPGPSGVGKDGVDAPLYREKKSEENDTRPLHNLCEKNSDATELSFLRESFPFIFEAAENSKKETKSVNCRRCKLSFDSVSSYKKHFYQMHRKKTYDILLCSICGKSIRRLQQHMESVHGDPNRLKCSKCDKTFKSKKVLSKHMLVHSNEYKHKCVTCGKGFKTPFSMRVHMRSHDAVKPFECCVCLKTFTTKQWRDNHMRTH